MTSNDHSFSKFKNTSLLNFSLQQDRQKMDTAIKKVKAQLGRTHALGSGAATTNPSRGLIRSENPARPSEIVGCVEAATKEDVETTLKKLHRFSKNWKGLGQRKRSQLLESLGDWLQEKRCELAAWMIFEVGKNWREADADVCEAIDFCRYYARQALKLSTPQLTQEVSGETNTLSYYPKGVAVVIAPWNFPLAILTGMTTAALVTGNTVVIKPAEQSSVIAAFLAQGLKAVGFPEDSFAFLPGKGEEIGPVLVEDPRVDLIAFTGSADVGLEIISRAAKKPVPTQRGVKRVIAEMGGKNAMIIDEDADLDEAIIGAVHSAFGFQGQKCSSLSRLLVHENIYDSFVERFVEATKSIRIGPPLNPEYQLGPVIDPVAKARIEKTIQEAKTRLKALYSAQDLPNEGYFVAPSVFVVKDRNDPLFQNEIFGPVVALKKVHSLDEAIEDVNSVRYALTGGIYSRSPSHIEEAKAKMEVGNLYINRGITGAIVERQPFGGFKLSGIGSKAGGPEYLYQFVEPRTIAENTVRRGFAGE